MLVSVCRLDLLGGGDPGARNALPFSRIARATRILVGSVPPSYVQTRIPFGLTSFHTATGIDADP